MELSIDWTTPPILHKDSECGRVLVWNRHFIRKRLSLSIGAPDNESTLQTPEDPSVCLPNEPHRSSRRTCRTDYLLEDPTWLLSSSVTTLELDGEV